MNRVWTYIINKSLSVNELNLIIDEGNKFVASWTAHEQKLTGSFEIYKNQNETNSIFYFLLSTID